MYRVRGADQSVYGPIPAGTVSQWIAERRLNAASEICREGEEQWLPLSQFPEFAAVLAAQAAGGPSMPGTPTAPGGGGPMPGGFPDDGGRDLARAAVDGPGIALIIVGVLGALMAVFGIVSSSMGMDDPFAANPELREQIPPAAVKFMEASRDSGPWVNILALLTSVYAVYCGLQLRQLRSYVHVVVGTVISMIPCVAGCCCLGLPVGIWILIVINRPNVRPYFTS